MKSIPIALAVLFGAALTTAAQDDAVRLPVDTMPTVRRNAVRVTAQDPASSPQSGITKLQEALEEYGRIIGKKILCDNTVQGAISFVADPSVSKEKNAELIERSLFLNGFTLVDVSDDAVAVLGLGKSVRNVGLPLYAKPEEIPHAERVFSYLFKLQHRNPLELQAFLQQFIPSNNACGFFADARSQTLVATGQTSVIRTLIRLVAALDVPPSPDKDAPPPERRPRENPPAPPRPLKPPQPIPNEGGDQ